MTGKIDAFGNLGATLHETIRAAAGDGPLATEVNTGATVVFPYQENEALAYDPRVAGVGLSLFDFMGIDSGPLRDWYGGIMFTNDGAVHRRLRGLASRAFTPHAVARLRGTAAALADEAVAPLAGSGGDLLSAFAGVQTKVTCALLGVPEDDYDVFWAWADDLSPVFLMMTPEQVATAEAAITSMLAYVDDLAERRRATPADDLISALLAAEDGGDRLTHQELISTVANLLVGGHDTTTSQIGCSLLRILATDGVAERATAEPELIPSVVLESTRLEPSLPFIPRTLAAPVEIAGEAFEAGTSIWLCFGAAARDPGTWERADEFDPARFHGPGAPRLLTFGAGPHHCIGSALAKITLEECLRATLDAGVTRLAADPADIPWRVITGRAPTAVDVLPA